MRFREHQLGEKPRRKRVLMVVENAPYPQDVRVRQEALTLIGADYIVSVISPRYQDQPLHEMVDGAYVYRYPAPPQGESLWGYLIEYGFSLLSIFFLSLIVSFRTGFDYLHTANPPDTVVLIGAIYKLFGKRFIFDHHDLSPEMYWVRFHGSGNIVVHKLLLFFEELSCRLADHIIATNNSIKQIDVGRNKKSEDLITIVRNGPNAKLLQPIEQDLNLRRNGCYTIVYVGAISVQDGLDYLIRALHYLAYELCRPDFHCYVVGAGSSLESIQKMAAENGLEKSITFTGWVLQDEVKSLISSADICVVPDPSNDYNDRCTVIKMMEYMSLSKPIVAFDLPEHRITAGASAVFARPNDEMDFARKIVELMNNPERRAKMGSVGRERVEKELAWQHQARRLLDAYKSLEN